MGGERRSKLCKTLLYCLVGAIWIVVCVWFEEFAPKCILKFVSGYDCPACGAQRAVRHLAMGEFSAAFWCNPYLAVLSPYMVLAVIAEIGGAATARLRERLTDRRIIIAAALIMLFWWILRNTPLWQDVLSECAPMSC